MRIEVNIPDDVARENKDMFDQLRSEYDLQEMFDMSIMLGVILCRKSGNFANFKTKVAQIIQSVVEPGDGQ